ncbi:DUF3307 domain-containing protein [Halomonas sp. HP20-15]|uniref:DUF3307 domain-containing protein n=1 Tax=Halomonas sp. HP20-15 TaxID=3085901 RepID=UPI0029825E51|nr:DUF3307 domain-containing protein [Halomonas sp. HP20-15]MDW5375325.1 DUF3307 domain-containing protein [Halomonas sp. HP20-15]
MMESNSLSLLLLLLLGHLIGDFLLQSQAWVRSKESRHYLSPAVYLHSGVQGLLALVALLASAQAFLPTLAAVAAISVTHLAIDIAKSYAPPQARYFLLDQALHVGVLVVVWALLVESPAWLATLGSWLLDPAPLLVALGYLLVLRPTSILIALIMRRWSRQVDTSGMLADAGARIGMLERFLVLTFVLADQLVPIGFLLAAKSVLRFGELREDRDRKLTEYVLLGTMLSFALTLCLGILIRRALTVL